MGFDLGVLMLFRSWLGFMQQCEEIEHAAEEVAMQRHLETLDDDELRQLLNE